MHSFTILPNVIIEQLLCNSTNCEVSQENVLARTIKAQDSESGLLAIAIEAYCKVLPHIIIVDVLPVLVWYFSSIIYFQQTDLDIVALVMESVTL